MHEMCDVLSRWSSALGMHEMCDVFSRWSSALGMHEMCDVLSRWSSALHYSVTGSFKHLQKLRGDKWLCGATSKDKKASGDEMSAIVSCQTGL
jgi:hypothetical protein